MFHTARRVIKADCLDSARLTKELATLRESNRMGKDPAHILQLHSRCGNQIMSNTEQVLTMDMDRVGEKQVVVFRDRSGERVLDGDDRTVHLALEQLIEDLRRDGAGHYRTTRQHLQSCLMAERAEFSLDGDFHVESQLVTTNLEPQRQMHDDPQPTSLCLCVSVVNTCPAVPENCIVQYWPELPHVRCFRFVTTSTFKSAPH